jgi:hypothetical protein
MDVMRIALSKYSAAEMSVYSHNFYLCRRSADNLVTFPIRQENAPFGRGQRPIH